ncbi:m7GpppN-mRNA hydrolase isoform X1 [Fopius arisanus]|uniref:m7GpppN-mRNA hydrolase n=2 Tax=Fopius arisanus TaxID=64838 RepID=A0A9R1TWZ5_9HYME|nr:PREDICTED: m7GpppN-mRNA hydrolase isoform X1 [Fopius arisanus]
MSQHAIPLDILDDLSSRFIINVPEEGRKDLVRICFQIELAHWFYIDFYCTEENPRNLQSCGMKEFATHIFKHIPFLQPNLSRIDSVLDQWREYKQSVPTFGAIVLNEDMTKVLLVQNYWARNSWGFPKGKVNEDEDPSHCAVREVLEETGFDISKLIDKNEYIESTINDRLVRLYIITGVQKETKFQPRTRKEIKSVEWFSLMDLPNNPKDMTPKVKMGVGPNAFFMVVPFVRRMKRWVLEKQQKAKQLSTTAKRHRRKSLGDAESGVRNRRQGLQSQNGCTEIKNERQSNTSPMGYRRAATKNLSKSTDKNPKGAIKRNLFGEPGDDRSTKSPSVLAKQLTDSPRIESQTFVKQNQRKSRFETDKKEKNMHTLLTDAVRKMHLNSQEPCDIYQLQPRVWMDFTFDKQAVLNCI